MPARPAHPLTRPQHTSAFTVAALFWGVGVTMIDPRTGIGAILCIIGISGTLWLYSGDLRKMPKTSLKNWPWIALLVIAIEILIPGYLLYARADDGVKTPGVISNSQNGGQTGGIINNNQNNSNTTINGNCNSVGDNSSPCSSFFGPQRLEWSKNGIQYIEKNLGHTDIDMAIVGDGKDFELGDRFVMRLKQDGFNILSYKKVGSIDLVPAPTKKITIIRQKDSTFLLIIPKL